VSLQGTSFEESRMIKARVELLRSSLMSAWISTTTRFEPWLMLSRNVAVCWRSTGGLC
jgi:hypothetical protein